MFNLTQQNSKYLLIIIDSPKFGKTNTMKQLTYRVLLNKEPEGGYTVSVPTLPGCITYGETIEESIEMAKEAIGLYIESLKAHGEPIPDETGTLEYSLTLTA
jgi:antitoxin HicB